MDMISYRLQFRGSLHAQYVYSKRYWRVPRRNKLHEAYQIYSGLRGLKMMQGTVLQIKLQCRKEDCNLLRTVRFSNKQSNGMGQKTMNIIILWPSKLYKTLVLKESSMPTG